MGDVLPMLVRIETLRDHRKRIRITCRTCRHESVLQGYYLELFIHRHGRTLTLNDLRRRSRCQHCRDKHVMVKVEETEPWGDGPIRVRQDWE